MGKRVEGEWDGAKPVDDVAGRAEDFFLRFSFWKVVCAVDIPMFMRSHDVDAMTVMMTLATMDDN